MIALLATLTTTQIGIAQVLALVAGLILAITVVITAVSKTWAWWSYLLLMVAMAFLCFAVMFGLPGGTG